MPQDIHVLLDQCKDKAEVLISEIEKYKSATAVNQVAAESLNSTSQALKAIIKQVRPFTDIHFRRFEIILFVWNLLNSTFLIAILLILLMRKG